MALLGSVAVFQSPLLGAVPSPLLWAVFVIVGTVSIPSSGGSAFTCILTHLSPGFSVSIPSSGGSAFTTTKKELGKEKDLFQSPLLGAVPSPGVLPLNYFPAEGFNPLFWGQCLHLAMMDTEITKSQKVSIPSSGGSAFTPGEDGEGAIEKEFQSPLLGAVPSPEPSLG